MADDELEELEDTVDDVDEDESEEFTQGDDKMLDKFMGKAIDKTLDSIWYGTQGSPAEMARRQKEAEKEAKAREKERRDRELHDKRMRTEEMKQERLRSEIEALKSAPQQAANPAVAASELEQAVINGELPLAPISPQFECPDNPEEFESFLHQLETYPTSMVILGTRGYGKSALAHAILEYLRFKTNKPAYILLAPRSKKHILPNWLQIVDEFDDVTPNSLLLVDEAGLILNSRSSQKRINRNFVEVNALLRQKGVTMIFVSQTSKTIDVNAFQVGDLILVWKKPSEMALSFERGFVKESGKNAMKLFKTIPKDDLKKYSVIGYDGESSILMTNGLASYWNEDVSCMYGQASDNSESRTDQIKRLHAQSMTQIEIAQRLGISQAYVSMIISGRK